MRLGLTALGFAALAAAAAVADDTPPTVTATKAEVAFHLDLAGAFDAKDPVEVAYKPKVWGDEVEIEEFRAPGPVAAGDVLVKFKSEKFDEALRAAERDLAVAKAQLATMTEDQARQLVATAAALARVEFDTKNAQQALDHFVNVERPLRLEEADHNLNGTKNWIADQTEELKQLEKMYKADDLTEETEEIVLSRARRDLDRAKRILDFQTRRDKVMREIDLPRELESLTLSAKSAAAERDKTVAVTKLQQDAAKLDLDRTRANVEKQEKDVAKLAADGAMLVLKAPVAGYAVPGSLLRGKWQNADDVRRALKKGGKFRPNDVVFTIADTHAWRVATSVPEASLAWLREGQEAKVVATQAGVKPWAAKVAPVMPFASGGEYAVDLVPDGDSEGLIGMTCKVRIETGKRAAILVPQTAVEDGGVEKSVYVAGPDGKPAKRTVALGQPYDDQVEVTAGVAEGDKVLVTAPKK
jgi:multidrug resistance efflux pump